MKIFKMIFLLLQSPARPASVQVILLFTFVSGKSLGSFHISGQTNSSGYAAYDVDNNNKMKHLLSKV